MKTICHLSLAMFTIALLLPAGALARDVYPDRNLDDIYVLATEGNAAWLKAKGAEREYVAIGDVVGEERMVVVDIDSLSVTVRSENGDTATRLPVGGGVGN